MLALEVSTYLTVVCPLVGAASLRLAVSVALAFALEEIGARRETIAAETAAVEASPLVLLRDRQLIDELDYTADICRIELGCHTDLRRIQRGLNALPHGGRDIPVPAEAAAARLAASPASHRTH